MTNFIVGDQAAVCLNVSCTRCCCHGPVCQVCINVLFYRNSWTSQFWRLARCRSLALSLKLRSGFPGTWQLSGFSMFSAPCALQVMLYCGISVQNLRYRMGCRIMRRVFGFDIRLNHYSMDRISNGDRIVVIWGQMFGIRLIKCSVALTDVNNNMCIRSDHVQFGIWCSVYRIFGFRSNQPTLQYCWPPVW